MNETVTMVPVQISITYLPTGESRVFNDELYTTPDYDGVFIWSDGNYSCDCNRALFFMRAVDYDGEDDNTVCGHKRYRVDYIRRLRDQVIVYAENDLYK